MDKLLLKRMKNNIAAKKCRQKKIDRIIYLEKEVKELQKQIVYKNNLEQENNNLKEYIKLHDCICPLNFIKKEYNY